MQVSVSYRKMADGYEMTIIFYTFLSVKMFISVFSSAWCSVVLYLHFHKLYQFILGRLRNKFIQSSCLLIDLDTSFLIIYVAVFHINKKKQALPFKKLRGNWYHFSVVLVWPDLAEIELITSSTRQRRSIKHHLSIMLTSIYYMLSG